jgi:hypothetical protein
VQNVAKMRTFCIKNAFFLKKSDKMFGQFNKKL